MGTANKTFTITPGTDEQNGSDIKTTEYKSDISDCIYKNSGSTDCYQFWESDCISDSTLVILGF